jgi:hypothetical protein
MLTEVDFFDGLRKRKIQEWDRRRLGGADFAFIADELTVYQIANETPSACFAGDGLPEMKRPFTNQPGPLFPAQQCGSTVHFALTGSDYQLEW